MTSPILELRKATKTMRGVPAIEDVDFDSAPGEIHALVGENGAGKSTLTKVMAGVVDAHLRARCCIDGQPVRAAHAAARRSSRHRHGVPGDQPGAVDDGRAEHLSRAREASSTACAASTSRPSSSCSRCNFDVDPTATVGLLGAAKRQMVEIARAVLHNAKVIIFDEPTASLTPEEKKHFFALVRDLKARGVSIIFISHALEEALLISDRITVLRDGKQVVTDDTRELRPRADRPGDGRPRPVADALRPAQDAACGRRASAC